MKWLDIYDIAISLEEKHPDIGIINLSFTKLKSLVCNLEDFDDNVDASNEKILEAIQMAWIEERE